MNKSNDVEDKDKSDDHKQRPQLSQAYLLFKLLQVSGKCQNTDQFVPMAQFISDLVKDEKDEKGQSIAKDFGDFLKGRPNQTEIESESKSN